MKRSKPRFLVRKDILFVDGKPAQLSRRIILLCLAADGVPDLPEVAIQEETVLRMFRLKRCATLPEKLEEDGVSLGTMYEMDDAGGVSEPMSGNDHPRTSRHDS